MASSGLLMATTGTMRELSNSPSTRSESREHVGSFRIERQLGEGETGVVYLAEDTLLRRQVALKVHASNDPAHRERILRDARAVAALDHDNIVRVYFADEVDGDLFVVMELLKGEALQTRLKREHRLKVREAMRTAREAAAGLFHAHRHGVIHRDIKPSNLWLETSGRVKILDLGLVHPVEESSLLDRLGTPSGTPGYMSPEQAAGETVTHSTDLFSLGCVLYQMVTGEKPFHGDSDSALMRATIGENPRSPREINPEVPEALDRLVLRMLAKAAQDRPASAREVEDQLAEIIDPLAPKRETKEIDEIILSVLGGKVTQVATTLPNVPPTLFSESVDDMKRRSYPAWIEHAVATLVLLAAVGTLGWWWWHSRDNKALLSAVSVNPMAPAQTKPPVK
jgi:serine/threonine protein kinase